MDCLIALKISRLIDGDGVVASEKKEKTRGRMEGVTEITRKIVAQGGNGKAQTIGRAVRVLPTVVQVS